MAERMIAVGLRLILWPAAPEVLDRHADTGAGPAASPRQFGSET